MSEILVPVKVVAECWYCRSLRGEKPHPMLPKEAVEIPKQCECHLMTDYVPRIVTPSR